MQLSHFLDHGRIFYSHHKTLFSCLRATLSGTRLTLLYVLDWVSKPFALICGIDSNAYNRHWSCFDRLGSNGSAYFRCSWVDTIETLHLFLTNSCNPGDTGSHETGIYLIESTPQSGIAWLQRCSDAYTLTFWQRRRVVNPGYWSDRCRRSLYST